LLHLDSRATGEGFVIHATVANKTPISVIAWGFSMGIPGILSVLRKLLDLHPFPGIDLDLDCPDSA